MVCIRKIILSKGEEGMSEKEEGVVEGQAVLPGVVVNQPVEEATKAAMDLQSYAIGEVPQPSLLDPLAYLPLDSDSLKGGIDKILAEAQALVQDEVVQIQKLQRKINFWEEKIEKNRAQIQKNQQLIDQNNLEIEYDKKNRDYWLSRAERVSIDYQSAAAGNRLNQWSWLIKKYGLKNADGTQIDPSNGAVDELCNGESNNLSGQYKTAGNKYEQAKKDKEAINLRLIRENSNLMNLNETLQSYIANTYQNEIEPLQDGVLMMKELSLKLKTLSQEESVTYATLRVWADGYLNQFLLTNPRVHQHLVTEFRKLTSIPLPADHC